MAALLICTVLAVLVVATPQVNYPLNLQFPPVALVGEQFNFQFAATTFSSDSNNLQYSLIGNPSWLALDSKSRTLSGTPRANDVGTASFTITAAAQAGAVASMEAKLLVSKDNSPIPQENISMELSQAGDLSGPRTISLRPSSAFNISFPPDIVTLAGKKLSYSATLADHTPLPAWLGFDGFSIRFIGTAPPTESFQSFDILLIACETPHFASSTVPFTVVISKHSLFFEPFGQTIHLTKGNNVHITEIREKLYFDSLPIQNDQLQSVSAELPAWLSFDNDTFEISGNAPADAMPQDVTITVIDRYGETAQQVIHLIFGSKLFGDEIGKLNLTTGESFEHKIPQSTFARRDESFVLDFASLSEFLHFDPSSSVISGTVPVGFPPRDVQCSITATSTDNTMKDTQQFYIEVLDPGKSAEGTPSKTGSQDQNGVEKASNHLHGTGWDRKKNCIIVGSVIGAVCCLAILVACMLCLRHRRKQRKSYISPKVPRSPRKSDISRPMFIPPGWPDMDENEDQDLERGKEKEDQDHFVEQRTQEHPPKLDLDLSVDRRDNHSVVDSIGDDDTRILDTFDESSWGIQNDTTPSQHPHGSMRVPTELARRASDKSDTFRKHKRRTTTIYQDKIHRSTRLPVNQSITGMGNARHTYSVSRSNTNFSHSSIRRPLSTNSYTPTRCTSTFSTAPSAFPHPPKARKHTTMVTIPKEERCSVRIVPSSTRSSVIDRRTIDERRNSYIRKRASAQSPFFSAGNRASSSSYRSPPAFIAEAQLSPRVTLSPNMYKIIVRPNDDVVAGREKEIPQSLRIVHSSGTLTEIPKQEFPGSLRKNRASKHLAAITAKRDRVEKSYARPGTASSSTMANFARRASTRRSFRAYDLKASLNDLTGSKVFEDAEMSDSVYSDEEQDIEEAEKRTTLKPGQFTLPPLNLDRVNTARNNKRDSQAGTRKSKQGIKRELKRTSERDPTPYYIRPGHEHGGKENASSTYSLGQRSSPLRIASKGKAKVITSPERSKPAITRNSHTTNEARKSHRASTHRTSIAPPHQDSSKERHSRKSIHSRSQSGSLTVKKPRDRSRTQSSAYPYFDAKIFEPLSTNRPSADTTLPRSNIDAAYLPASTTKPSLITRDLSGNLTFYYGDEEPTIEELGSSSIGFRTSNGRINSAARQSRLASLHLSSQQQQVPQVPPKSEKRKTVVPPSSSHARPVGLGLFPQECPGDRARERTPLATLQAENEGTAEVEGGQGGKTWGSLKSIVGRGSRWVSGGNWRKDDKVFI